MAASNYAQMQDIRTCTDIDCLLQYIGDYITCKISGGNIMNSLYELLDMDISAKYSYVTRTLLMGFFYMSIFPFGIPICCIGFIFA